MISTMGEDNKKYFASIDVARVIGFFIVLGYAFSVASLQCGI